ncbi:hypothetical protein LXL04_008483 [Taraxacum kok-saghyz]
MLHLRYIYLFSVIVPLNHDFFLKLSQKQCPSEASFSSRSRRFRMEYTGGRRSLRYELDEETNDVPATTPAGLTVGGILSIKQTPPYRIQDRTLLDLIRDDQTCGKEPKATWKMFREKLRLKDPLT